MHGVLRAASLWPHAATGVIALRAAAALRASLLPGDDAAHGVWRPYDAIGESLPAVEG